MFFRMYREVYRIGICFQRFFEVNLWTKKRFKNTKTMIIIYKKFMIFQSLISESGCKSALKCIFMQSDLAVIFDKCTVPASGLLMSDAGYI